MGHVTGKRILITGGAGFLGRFVCSRIAGLDPEAIIVPRKKEYDLSEQAVVRELLDDCRPDVVIHLAAVVGGIEANRQNPGRFFYDNIVMGLLLMEEARRRKVEKFVTVGTICSYPKITPIPFRESDLWNGYPEETNAPYGIAKKALLVQGQAYRQQYGFNAITLLPVNLYGPGDNFDPRSSHVIPALIAKMVAARDAGKDEVEVWGSGTATREFLFVRDAADAIVRAVDRYDEPDPVNLGSGQEVSIARLVELVKEVCAYRGQIRWDPSRPAGQPRRCVDTSRARERFGFVATTALRDGLNETVRWYESRGAGSGRGEK
jgi:GDP-L-fucose synthase